MRDFIVLDGDQALFMPNFGAALVVVQPGRLRASGPMKSSGKRVCVAGDEASVSVPGCSYMTPQFSIPGTGTLSISRLADDQLAPASATGGARLMVRGSMFTAKFQVQAPAMQPPPGPGPAIPDVMLEYSGAGMFQTINGTVKAG